MIAAINAQITIEFKIFNKFSGELSRTPYKARLCISKCHHHDKSRIEGQDRIAGQNRGQGQTQNRGLRGFNLLLLILYRLY